MAKKNKDDVPNVNSVTNRDILQRMNFLYQASTYLSLQTPPKEFQGRLPAGLKGKEKKEEMRRRNKARHSTAPEDLSRAYVKSMKAIGQKTTMRLDPSVKRTLCKTCNLVLIPGRTELVRIKPWPGAGHAVCYTCMSCQQTRRIPAPPVLGADAASDTDETEASTSHAQHPTGEVPTQMDVADAHAQSTPAAPAQPKPKPKRKRGPQPRLPPLFERNAGHVVFRGNERIA